MPSDEPPAAMRVAVVARRPSLRAGLGELLLRGGVEVVLELDPDPPAGEQTGAPTLEDIDALVVELADLDGLASGEVPGWLATALGELPALLLVEAPGQPLPPVLAVGADEAPPRGWLSADAAAAEVAAAVAALVAGLDVVAPSLARAAGTARPAPAGREPADLTARELQVLELVALGLPNKAVAQRLGISEHTVKFHVGSLLSKLDAGSRTEAVTAAVRGGLLAL
jgi:DNA-binding CsgD family transcriptional regulator